MIEIGKKLIIGLGISVFILVLFEFILFLFGVTPLSDYDDPYVGFSGYSNLYQISADGTGQKSYMTNMKKLKWFNLQSFPVNKEKNTYRIFCLGGSTTYGRPYNDKTSFAGWIRSYLPVLDPSKKYEVINAGGISYASYRVARLMEELVEYEPDLFIVYSGHNEFLEARTYESLLNTPEFVRDLGSLASHLRIYSLMYEAVAPDPDLLSKEVNAILDRSVGPDDYQRDDELQSAVVEHYRLSIERMIELSNEIGSDIIFVNPASNIGDFTPFKSETHQSLPSKKIEELNLLKFAISAAIDENNFQQAVQLSEKALEIDPRNPDILFHYGKSLQKSGRTGQAKIAFTASRDEDICPLRAQTSIQNTLKDVVNNKNKILVDFNEFTERLSEGGIPGSNLFLDHVHPTIEGNRLLALEILSAMKNNSIINESNNWNEKIVSEISNQVKSSIDEKSHATALKNLSKVLSWAGKDSEAQILAKKALAISPDDGSAYFQQGLLLKKNGDFNGALKEYKKAIELNPWNAIFHRGLGALLSELGRKDEALTSLNKAISIDPNLAEAHYDIGLIMQERRNLAAAEKSYLKTIKIRPLHADANNNLGVVYAMQRKMSLAEKHFRQALEGNPNHEGAKANLARLGY